MPVNSPNTGSSLTPFNLTPFLVVSMRKCRTSSLSRSTLAVGKEKEKEIKRKPRPNGFRYHRKLVNANLCTQTWDGGRTDSQVDAFCQKSFQCSLGGKTKANNTEKKLCRLNAGWLNDENSHHFAHNFEFDQSRR